MYIYNVTINIEESIHNEWLEWMREIHIPGMLATKKFSSARILKVHIEEEMDGITYAVQYTTDSKETLLKYYKENAPEMREEGMERFPNKFVAFRTELEVISNH